MAKLSDEQIAAAAYKAGFTSKDLLSKFVAIALAESGGETTAKNNVNEGHFGLWQIAGVHHALIDKYGKANIFDPQINAKMAYEIYKGQGISAWETYTRGMYLAFMSRGRKAADKIRAAALGDPTLVGIDLLTGGVVSGVEDSITGTIDTLAKFTELFANKQTWVRVGYFAAAWILIMMGLNRTIGAKTKQAVVGVAKAVVMKKGMRK